MTVLTVAGLVVAAAIVAAIVVAAHRSRSVSDPGPATPVDASALGGVPGYMPGMSPTVERRDAVTASRIDPPDAGAAVDLDGNVARLRRAP